MGFGLLLTDNSPVDFQGMGRLRRRRFRGITGSRFRGYGRPYGAQAMVQLGWVDSTGGGDDPTTVPGTNVETEHSTWQDIATGVLTLGTSITNAVAGSIRPNTSGVGSSCPSGYYPAGGRCYPIQSSGGDGGMGMMLGLGVLGLGAFLLLRKKG